MRHLNYDHLRYFWMTARLGSVTAAAAELHLAPQTISGQVKQLEAQIGGALLERAGRRLVPTALGRTALEYADEIFHRGQELASLLRGAPGAGRRTLAVGVADTVPKLVTLQLLQPAIQADSALRINCRHGELATLLGELLAHRLDVLFATHPVGADAGVRVYSHQLAESELAVYAAAPLARRLRKGFPASLNGAPMLLPGAGSPASRVLLAWFELNRVAPLVAGEFDDSALLKTFGQAGLGAFCAPASIQAEVCRQHRVRLVGRIPDLTAKFYALTAQRRVLHPGVTALLKSS